MFEVPEIRLSRGSHTNASEGLCFMEMVAWFEGEAHSDKPACACPVLGRYGIGLNDRMPDDLRDQLLKPLVPLMAGTRDAASAQQRAGFLAMWVVNRVLPMALDAVGIDSKACREASNLTEVRVAADAAADAAAYTTADAARAAARAARAAAYAATYAADADYAADYADYAADAADYAADAAPVWPVAVEGLRQATLIGRHDGFTSDVAVRHAALRELVN